ncbi:hypothetical protein ACFX2A_043956 [Malus domestica]
MDSELHFHADLLSSSPLTSLPQAAQWQHSPLGPLPASLRAALLLSVFLCCLTSLPKDSVIPPVSLSHAALKQPLPAFYFILSLSGSLAALNSVGLHSFPPARARINPFYLSSCSKIIPPAVSLFFFSDLLLFFRWQPTFLDSPFTI